MAEWRAPSGTRCWDVYGRNGWAESECGRTDKHDRHVWNHEHAWYGPYTCPGHPIYEGKHRLDREPAPTDRDWITMENGGPR